jgi:hypothetical protein
MTFSKHVMQAAAKAEKTAAMLARVMPNLAGPSSARRLLLTTVTTSILLYGAEIWAGDPMYAKDVRVLIGVQRRVLIRVIVAYRTISAEAAQVIAGAPPVDLLATERALLGKAKETGLTRAEARRRTEREWQRRWATGEKAAWTRELIPEIQKWTEREHGNVDFHLVQVLSGHGCFSSYLKRIGKSDTDKCWYCDERDDAEHTLFRCPKWDGNRLLAMRRTAEWPEKKPHRCNGKVQRRLGSHCGDGKVHYQSKGSRREEARGRTQSG